MQFLVTLVFLAVAAAGSELKPIELPAPAAPALQADEQAPLDKYLEDNVVVDAVKVAEAPESEIEPTIEAEEITPVRVVDAPIAEPTDAAEDVIVPVNVVDASSESVPETGFQFQPLSIPGEDSFNAVLIEELPLDDPEAMRRLFEETRNLIDIGPMFVSDEVIRRAAMMADADTPAGDVASGPFSINDEPLDQDNFDRVIVVDGPNDEMDPILIREPTLVQQANNDMPEMVKVVDISDFQNNQADIQRPMPKEMWRDVPSMPEYLPPTVQNQQANNDLPEMVKVVDISDFQNNQQRPMPKEMWRDVPSMPEYLPPTVLNQYRPRPAYFRDANEEIPQYNRPLSGLNDPYLR